MEVYVYIEVYVCIYFTFTLTFAFEESKEKPEIGQFGVGFILKYKVPTRLPVVTWKEQLILTWRKKGDHSIDLTSWHDCKVSKSVQNGCEILENGDPGASKISPAGSHWDSSSLSGAL